MEFVKLVDRCHNDVISDFIVARRETRVIREIRDIPRAPHSRETRETNVPRVALVTSS